MSTSKSYTQKRWSLGDLYPSADSAELKHDLEIFEALAQSFEKKRSLLTDTISQADFMAVIHELEEIYRIGNRMGSFAELWYTENTQNQEALGLVAKTEQLFSEVSNRTLFFGLWWKDLPEEKALPLMDKSGDYRYWLE